MASMIGLNNNSDDSDSENVGNRDEVTITKKKRGEGKTYFFSETFASLELAKKAVEEEETWSWKAKKVEKNITKHYYRCNKVKQRSPRQCSTGLVLILKAESQEVELHRTLCAHDHIEKVVSVSQETRHEINKMFAVTVSLTPNNILENLNKINDDIVKENQQKPLLQIPKKRCLYNYLAELRRKKYGHSNMTLGELSHWCHEHLDVPPENEPDTVFVVKCDFFW